ncbi:phage major tail tube protein [Bengtsoniella intestinalis]|uniref:phage major tail tube protein n=1 Tax=Bengtsoniella intestinalis TaxID=3073143 RepID=UPI00391FBB80
MAKIAQSVINLALYEDGDEYHGVTKTTLPDITFLSNTISGAGIAGNVEAIVAGMVDAMTLGIDWRTLEASAVKLNEPRPHVLDLRTPQSVEDTTDSTLSVQNVKHVMVVIPKTMKAGSIAPATPTGASGEFAVRSWATYIDGERIMEIAPMDNICYINGVDYLADARSALGK